MAVKAKFYISEVILRAKGGNSGSVKLNAVSRGAENAMWASASPSGELTMYVANPRGFAFFRDHIGEEVSITFQLAKTDPATHAFVALDPEDAPHAIGPQTPTCVECGHPEEAHS